MEQAGTADNRESEAVLEKPRISIITASYNNKKGIEQTLLSVQAQSMRPMEHLIIDGGSKDGTVEWIQGDAALGVVLVSEPDEGIYDAMNKGLRLAKGELVLFLNGGDTLHDPEVLEHVASSWSTGGWSWGYGVMRYVGDDRRPIRTYTQDPFSRKRTARGLAFAPHPTTFVERDLLLAIGGFDLNLGFSADQDVAVRLGKLSAPTVWSRIITDYLIVGAHSASSFLETASRYRAIRVKNDLLVGGLPIVDLLYTYGIAAFWRLRSKLGTIRHASMNRRGA